MICFFIIIISHIKVIIKITKRKIVMLITGYFFIY